MEQAKIGQYFVVVDDSCPEQKRIPIGNEHKNYGAAYFCNLNDKPCILEYDGYCEYYEEYKKEMERENAETSI